MTHKTFETTEDAKEFGLARCQSLCKPDRQLCNPEFGQARNRWRNCLKFRLSLCQHYSYRSVPNLSPQVWLSYCTKPQAPDFCLGKQCKELPKVVVEGEQTVNFHFGANAPPGPDFKKRAAGDDSSL